jgi:hypothetical protein
MQEAYPNQPYANEASARRQFNKVIKGSITGSNIEKRGKVTLPGGAEAGLWVVKVHFKYLTHDGEAVPFVPCHAHICVDDMHCQILSFTMQSDDVAYGGKGLTNYEDLPYIKELLPALVNQKMIEWSEQDTNSSTVFWDVAWMVVPAARSEVQPSKRLDLDNVVIE